MSTEATETQEKKGEEAVPEFDFENATLEDFEGRLKSDPALRDEFLLDATADKFERFNTMKGQQLSGIEPETQNADAEAMENNKDQPAQQEITGADGENDTEETIKENESSEESEEEKINVSVEISKSMLGTYLKNRSPEEAVVEALKGKAEADRFIDSQKGKINSLSTETTDLRKKLVETLKEKDNLSSKIDSIAAQQQEVEEVDYNAEIEKLDLDFPEDQKKVKDLLKKATTRPQSTDTEQPKTDGSEKKDTPPTNQEVDSHVQAMRDSVIDKEFAEISDLQRSVPILRTKRDFKDIDTDVGKFYHAVGRAAGNSENYMDSVNLYFSETEAGEQIRTLCSRHGIVPPEEIEIHAEILKLKAKRDADLNDFRKTMSATAGRDVELYEMPTIPNTSYLDYYQRENPVNVQREKLASRIEGHRESHRAAATANANVAPEIPADNRTPSTMGKVESMSEAEQVKLVQTPANIMTVDQAKMAVQLYQTQNIPCPQSVLKKAQE